MCFVVVVVVVVIFSVGFLLVCCWFVVVVVFCGVLFLVFWFFVCFCLFFVCLMTPLEHFALLFIGGCQTFDNISPRSLK